MDETVRSKVVSHPAWRNHVVPVRGTDVTAYLGESTDARNGTWVYSLWNMSADVGEEMFASDALDLSGLDVTPDQVARVAFLLSVEYPEV